MSILFSSLSIANTLLFIEGNTGAGKTTLAQLLRKKLGALIIKEPLEKWRNVGGCGNLFDIYLHDRKRWGFIFQSYAITTFMQTCMQADPTKKLHVADRSAYSTFFCFCRMMLEEGSMTPLEFQVFKENFEWIIQQSKKPNGIIYLRTSPENCFLRVTKRNRSEEDTLNMNFFILLHKFHEEWLIQKQKIVDPLVQIPTLVLDGNLNFASDPEVQSTFLKQIRKFISKLY